MLKIFNDLIKILFLIICFNYAFADNLNNNKLIIVLDWFINPDHAPLFVADQEGFFKKYGLEIEFITPSDPADPIKLVAAHKADIAISYQPQFTLALCEGLPLHRIASLINRPLNSLAVLSESKINNITDFKNKTHGYSLYPIDIIILNKILKKYNLNKNSIKNINIHYNLSQGLLSKKVDIISGVMRNFGPIEFELLHKKIKLFYPEDYGVPSYDELILITNKNNINNNKIKLFIKALSEGVSYLKKYPELSFEKFIKNHPELNNELNKRVWFATLPFFADDPAKFDKARYNNFASFLYHEEVCKNKPNF
jgi:putative hydroxymethylpyrimidine transport system substrate-binding protein